MPLVAFTRKRQVTIPPTWAATLGLEPGTRVWMAQEGDAIVIRRAPASWTAYFAGICPLPPEPADAAAEASAP